MVFSLASVCISYIFGMIVSTLYIRNLKLVGAGFFWMMWLTQITLGSLAFVTSIGTEKWLSLVAVLVCSTSFALAVANRKLSKSLFPKSEIAGYLISIAVLILLMILMANSSVDGFKVAVESARLIVGGLLLGIVTTTMLLGHWYLVQPGLTRKPISKMCIACIWILLLQIGLWLLPMSMLSVFTGEVSDGWGGTLGYMWIGSCLTTGALLFVAYKALQEKSYSAVMATTGLLYLAILVVNGVELIPRAIFS